MGLTRAFATTSVGRVRPRNEDAFLVMPGHDLYVVADGMGGHQRGDVAANLCVDSIRDWFTGKVSDARMNGVVGLVRTLFGLRSDGETDLVAAVEFANRVIFDMSNSSPSLRGMGTTLVSTYFHGGQVFVVFSGDSRVYRCREGRLRQLSRDHSLVNEYIRMEMIRPSEARAFPHRNVIMKALGLKEQAELEFFRRKAVRGDIYLLCSDGLTDMIDDDEIEGILAGGASDLEGACRRLIEAAMDAGGHDNITVLLAEYGGRA